MNDRSTYSFRTFATSAALFLPILAGCGGRSPIVDSADSQLFLYNNTARLEFERGETSYAAAAYAKALDRARAMDDAPAITAAAYNLGICRAALGDSGGASSALQEAEREAVHAGVATADILLVKSRVALMRGDPAEARRSALAVITRIDAKPVDAQRVSALVLIGMSAIQEGDLPSARLQLDEAKFLSAKAPDAISQAAIIGLSGEIHLLSREFTDAVVDFDHQAQLCQHGHDYRTMIRALAKAGRAAGKAGNSNVAADRLYRAARAATAAHSMDGESLLTEAQAAAVAANDATLIQLTTSLPAPSTQPVAP